MITVNQINDKNIIIEDYDCSLSPKEIFFVLKKHIPNIHKEGSVYFFEHNSVKCCIYIKNITYLGIPHPIYKKRIQISSNIKALYQSNTQKGIKTIILGIYGYNDEVIFCNFITEDYIHKKTHNSSAHVNIFDLKKAKQEGEFSRTDYSGNHIYLFTEKNFADYFSRLNSNQKDDASLTISTIDDFMKSLKKEWFGVEAYDEMFKNSFADKKQSEWAGFFLEYMLQKYLIMNIEANAYVEYRKSKKEEEIDLDLYFPKLKFYGDLKTHSDSSSGILGNDWRMVDKTIDEYGRIWYVICEHKTEKDSKHHYEVTEHWNNLLVKEDSTSYGEKMKYSITLQKYYILEINRDNFDYLTTFKQGRNSNGKPRESKISISKKNIDMFLLHSFIFK